MKDKPQIVTCNRAWRLTLVGSSSTTSLPIEAMLRFPGQPRHAKRRTVSRLLFIFPAQSVSYRRIKLVLAQSLSAGRPNDTHSSTIYLECLRHAYLSCASISCVRPHLSERLGIGGREVAAAASSQGSRGGLVRNGAVCRKYLLIEAGGSAHGRFCEHIGHVVRGRARVAGRYPPQAIVSVHMGGAAASRPPATCKHQLKEQGHMWLYAEGQQQEGIPAWMELCLRQVFCYMLDDLPAPETQVAAPLAQTAYVCAAFSRECTVWHSSGSNSMAGMPQHARQQQAFKRHLLGLGRWHSCRAQCFSMCRHFTVTRKCVDAAHGRIQDMPCSAGLVPSAMLAAKKGRLISWQAVSSPAWMRLVHKYTEDI